ncbi:DUF2871 domain-containing protein [Sporolactobacillus terrae]|uniref:DUF2871 domain-containing protein n=1 Tax=Sporolactobacillus terrae TaxID=269673 RepID=A0A410D902_9BACL|nr:DUF2871 domain-containing protein [Sporolactobacillus terrae]QAA22594.1 DUF2871 domain-containing protein [Sporolactobacillus terrae]QAA25567.1 DUF2871 domain-containing protein [Sporolactobacillus terrae]UAK17376.1 DUF2871 domain-containing protein [Sporolactobacillus terrae]BBN98916.1 membrane protein [Sporolactobacillus terrae]
MKKLYAAALGYMIAGLLSGIYYRELTKALNFSGETMLSVLHTHLLILGMFFFLILISLEKLFQLSTNKRFSLFFWIYNIGVVWTITLMAIHGTLDVLGIASGPAIAGLAGMGHIILSIGLILFFMILKEVLFNKKA